MCQPDKKPQAPDLKESFSLPVIGNNDKTPVDTSRDAANDSNITAPVESKKTCGGNCANCPKFRIK